MDRMNLYTEWSVGGDSEAMKVLVIYSLFYLGYSSLGMLAFALAIRPIASLLRVTGKPVWPWGLPFFPLVSLGVYLGLMLRFNSWDLFVYRGRSLTVIEHAVARPKLLAFMLAFSAFLWLAYLVLDIRIDGALLRWKRWTTSVPASEGSGTTLPARQLRRMEAGKTTPMPRVT